VTDGLCQNLQKDFELDHSGTPAYFKQRIVTDGLCQNLQKDFEPDHSGTPAYNEDKFNL